MSLAELDALDLERRPGAALDVLERFVALNEDAASSANYSSPAADPLGGVVALLGCAGADPELLLAVLKTLKILSRKYDNRVRLGSLVCDDLVSVLCASEAGALAVAAEAANVVLNICYEKENVTRIMAAGGVKPLLNLLARPQADLQANAAGAIQSICFQKEGRSAVREEGAIPALMPLLSSDSLRVQTRAVGAIHNLSSEAEAIRIIRKLRGIAPLVTLLRAPSAAVCGSAAGALQNLSREQQSRQEIHQLGAVMPLVDLLLGDDVQSQVCAAGALLNVLGPALGPEEGQNPKRAALKKLLTLGLTAGLLHSSLRGGPQG